LIGFGRSPALVVIDYQRAFTDPAMPLGANLGRELQATKRLLTASRRARIPIYFTVVYYDEEGFADAGIWLSKSAGQSSLKAGTAAVEIDARVRPRPEEAVILKKYASAFFGTDLISRLTARRVDTVILAGCTTSGCVRATTVDALQNGFRPMVVREAVGDRMKPAHEQSLFDMQIKYADIVTLEETVEYLKKLNGVRHSA
jgi:nicotinamidase-related amidase